MIKADRERAKNSGGEPIPRDASENGFLLVTAIFLLALFALSLSIALPLIAREIQRDREREAIHRGKEYIRAIQLYYRKFHRYPTNLQALEKTDNVRFLRKAYADPITGKDDWQPILLGQNKVPTGLAFFGQPVEMASTANTGLTAASANKGSSFLSGDQTTFGASSNPLSSTNQPSSTEQAYGSIIGVLIPSEKQSIVLYKLQDHYNRWEFVYEPLVDPTGQRVATGNVGQPTSAVGNSQLGSTPGISGSSVGGGGIGVVGSGSQWGPNGNLPAPVGGTPTSGPWGPNGNLPSPTPP